MKILYYTWNENSYADCVEAMHYQGWQVDTFAMQITDYDADEAFIEKMLMQLQQGYDFIFSFDYFPVISRIAQERNIPYVSWVYDSPHLTLESKTLKNSCNRVFIFDRQLMEKYLGKGIETVYYMPLPVNVRKSESRVNAYAGKYEHEVTFLGSLYDDDKNFFDQIQHLPEQMKGFADGLIEAQLLLYGYDAIGDVFDESKCEELARYANVDLGPLYEDCRNDIFRDMLRKKATVVERRRLISNVAMHFPLDLFASTKPVGIPLRYLGYADYQTQMPVIFRTSKINLNITLRSILSGIPLRVVDILGAGGFVLTNYQSELPEYFVNGQDIVWYESEQDMLDKIEYYLKHDAEREQIAINGQDIAKQIFSYDVLWPEIMKQL